MRGEVLATLGGTEIRLCVTLKALALMESHFDVASFSELGTRLKTSSAHDLLVVLQALSLEDIELSNLNIGLSEASAAIAQAFSAAHV
jgi:hypothetical protein